MLSKMPIFWDVIPYSVGSTNVLKQHSASIFRVMQAQLLEMHDREEWGTVLILNSGNSLPVNNRVTSQEASIFVKNNFLLFALRHVLVLDLC
jgi:hypothetical protein